MVIFINLQKSIFSISDINICPSKSFYNKNGSTSYQNKNGLSKDSFYFYSDIQLSKIEKISNIFFKKMKKMEKIIFVE